MREILFKAKRKNWRELPKEEWWVEGYVSPCIIVGKWYICRIEENLSTTQIEIDPETLCQYTGLTNKNGKKIWENDILCGHLDEEYPENITYEKVFWDVSGFCTKEECSVDIEPLDEWDEQYFEVCGNVFDNPELLEVE